MLHLLRIQWHSILTTVLSKWKKATSIVILKIYFLGEHFLYQLLRTLWLTCLIEVRYLKKMWLLSRTSLSTYRMMHQGNQGTALVSRNDAQMNQLHHSASLNTVIDIISYTMTNFRTRNGFKLNYKFIQLSILLLLIFQLEIKCIFFIRLLFYNLQV